MPIDKGGTLPPLMTLMNYWENILVSGGIGIAGLVNPPLAENKLRPLRQPRIFIVKPRHPGATRLQVCVTKFNHVARQLDRRLDDFGIGQNISGPNHPVSEITKIESGVHFRVVTVAPD